MAILKKKSQSSLILCAKGVEIMICRKRLNIVEKGGRMSMKNHRQQREREMESFSSSIVLLSQSTKLQKPSLYLENDEVKFQLFIKNFRFFKILLAFYSLINFSFLTNHQFQTHCCSWYIIFLFI